MLLIFFINPYSSEFTYNNNPPSPRLKTFVETRLENSSSSTGGESDNCALHFLFPPLEAAKSHTLALKGTVAFRCKTMAQGPTGKGGLT